jgi:hypothetical protein
MIRVQNHLRFSLRTLLIAFMVFSVALALVARPIHRSLAQHAAIEAIRQHGGEVLFDHYWNNLTFAYDVNAGGSLNTDGSPGLLTRIGGSELFGTVTAVRAEGSSFGNAEMRQLAHLTDLRRLILYDTRVTEEGLRVLREVPHLDVVIVSGKQYSRPMWFRNPNGNRFPD